MLALSDLATLLEQPTVGVSCAGRLLGLKSRNAAYRAREAGDIPSIKIGGQYRVPTAKLREMLGLPPQVMAQPTRPSIAA